jgi:hypothetical protein
MKRSSDQNAQMVSLEGVRAAQNIQARLGRALEAALTGKLPGAARAIADAVQVFHDEADTRHIPVLPPGKAPQDNRS